MREYSIRNGYNVPVIGSAVRVSRAMPTPNLFSVRPTEFHYVKPKLDVAIGDSVKVGTCLFHDKRQPELKFSSPAAGKIHSIDYGARRRIERININAQGSDTKQWPSFQPDEISLTDANKLQELLLEGGMWPHIRQRPYDIIANPQQRPDAIFINCMDTAPLASEADYVLQERMSDFKAGVSAMSTFCDTIHVVTPKTLGTSIFAENTSGIKGIQFHCFSGSHPAGLVGTHIHHISSLGKAGKVVWHLNARDAALIGSFLLIGQYPTDRLVALAGSGVLEKERAYFKMQAGASLEQFLEGKLNKGEMRIISGNVLTGKEIQKNDSIGFYDDLISVIPAGRKRYFLAWMLPGFNRPTWSRTFLSRLRPSSKQYAMNANRNGEERAFVKTGDYEKVVALDILPAFLIKAILTEDIELMEQLGIYETAPEDLALCSYICPSKIEFTEILRSGLDMMLEEAT